MEYADCLAQLHEMSCIDLIELVYWNNHGGDTMDIERGDWTLGMLADVFCADYDSVAEFGAAYYEYLGQIATNKENGK